jgi:thiol-disulfide isomerase/thioredoxin
MKKASIFAVIVLGAFTVFLVSLAAMQVVRAIAARRDLPAAHSEPAVNDSNSSEAAPAVIRFARNAEHMTPFEINSLNGGTPHSTAELHGKVLLIAFWASWCGPCREEIPELNTLAARYKNQLQVIGISEDDDPPAEVKKFANRVGITYPVMMATKEITEEFGEVPALPTTFIVDPDGAVVQKHTGLYSTDTYDREIRALLKMPVNAKIETFDDQGQIFLKNAARATELPGVDLTGLSAEQRKAALKKMNSENCTCGCNLTIAECRINDATCETSRKLATNIVHEIQTQTGGTATTSR